MCYTLPRQIFSENPTELKKQQVSLTKLIDYYYIYITIYYEYFSQHA